jgi:hypothetical protein
MTGLSGFSGLDDARLGSLPWLTTQALCRHDLDDHHPHHQSGVRRAPPRRRPGPAGLGDPYVSQRPPASQPRGAAPDAATTLSYSPAQLWRRASRRLASTRTTPALSRPRLSGPRSKRKTSVGRSPGKWILRVRSRQAGKLEGIQASRPRRIPLSLSIVLNVIFAAFVLAVIPGMLVLAIRTSRKDGPAYARAARRPRPHPSLPSTRVSSGQRRPATVRGRVQDAR